MEYELITEGPCRRKMVLKFTVEDIAAAFDDSYEEINNYVQIKGFRKGKAPRRTLEKRFADEAASGVRSSLTEKHVGEAIKKDKLQVLGPMDVKNSSELPEAGKPFTMEIWLDVAPDFELPSYKGLELAARPLEVSDEKITEALERYRKMFADYQPVDGPAELGDILHVDFVAKIAGEEVMNRTEQRLRVEGEKLFDLPCPGLEEKLKGAKAGDKIELTVNMPDDHQNEALRGKPSSIEMSVKKVERGTLPELNDAFAANLGMDSLANFRERVRANLIRDAMVDARSKQENEIIDKLLAAVPFEIPANLAASEANALVEQRRMRLKRSNVPDAEIESRLGQFRAEAADLAARQVRWGVMATKIAEAESITVSQEDMANQVDALARSYNTTPAKIIQRIREFDGVGSMMSEILSLKVVQFIIDAAKGGKNDPDNKDADSGAVNAAAAQSVTKPEAGPAEGGAQA